MEINVGEYIRTFDDDNRGQIGLVIKNYDNELEIVYKKYKLKTTISNFIDRNRNYKDGLKIKHSKDIIDLIEVGDYVNGSKVIDIRIDEELEIGVESDNLIYHYIQNKDIKSVLTKEQYIQNAYTIEKER